MSSPLVAVRQRVADAVVGREREIDLLLAAVAAGRDVVLEGPPGTSKTTLLRAITESWDIPLVFVEGNADLTPARLVGHHDPARVLREDYQPSNFVDGPLVRAMRTGGFLYIEEFNRAPDDAINTLLTAMADRRIEIPRVGSVAAAGSFRVIASMNPYDNIGTTLLSTSVHDRMCRLSIDYQDEPAERAIVARRAPVALESEFAASLGRDAVAVTRATRKAPEIRQGSSVRGAIDLTLVAAELLAMRGIGSAGGSGRYEPDSPREQYALTFRDAMMVALSGRIQLDETDESTPEQVLERIWTDYFLLTPATAAPG